MSDDLEKISPKGKETDSSLNTEIISDNKNNENNKNNKKKKSLTGTTFKRIFKRIFKWIFMFGLFLLLLLIGIFIFIQTDTFDKLALNYILDKVNSSIDTKETKDSRIYAESLEGNIFKGITLKNGSVRVKSDTLMKFSSIELKYSILPLLRNEISVQEIIIRDPQINLTTVKDKNDSIKWNLSYLLSSDEPDTDTSKSVFDWKITAENLQIENGAVRILENKNSDSPIREIKMRNIDTINFSNLDLSNLNLNLSGKYFPDMKEVEIKKLDFKTNSKFNVNSLTLKANVNETDTITKVTDLHLQTDRSDIVFNEVKMNQLNPFNGLDYETFDGNDTKVDIELRNFNNDDLTFFLPEVNFLDSTIALNFIAEGNYEDLMIEKLDLKLPNSKFSFTGNIKNLDEPDKLYFNITGKDIEIDPRDTKNVVPGLDIPDYTRAGRIIIPSITYVGEPEKFSSDLDARTGAGNVKGNVFFDLTQNEIKYRGDIITSNVNLGTIVNDKKLESSITGDFKVDAVGFDYQKATGKLNYNIRNTKFLGQNISKSGGQLNFNRGNIGLDIDYNSSNVKTRTKGRINISNLKNITYDLKGTVSGLNVASFTKDNTQNSNLSFDFDVKGRGYNPNDLAGEYKIMMKSSTFADFNIPSAPVDVSIGNDGSIKKISVKSDFADLSADGSFDINSLSNAISININKIRNELMSGLHVDSLNSIDAIETGIQNVNTNFGAICKNFNMQYKITVKDLAPLYSFTGNDTINFKGNINGMVSDSCGVFSLLANADIYKFIYKDSIIFTRDAKANIDITNDINASGLSKFRADIGFDAAKMTVSHFPLDTTKARLRFFNGKNDFLLSSNKDSTVKLFSVGKFADSLNIVFDSLALKYNEFNLTNNKSLIVKYNDNDTSTWIDFKQFTLSNINQRFNVNGIYSLTDSSHIKLTANNVKLLTYEKLINPDIDTVNAVSGNLRRFELSYNGTFDNPYIKLETNSDVLSIGGTKIGRLDAFINYDNDNMIPDISFNNVSGTGNFKLTGNIPIINPMSSQILDSAEKIEKMKGKEVSLTAKATNFQMKVLQQLLPYTQSLQGILDGKINLVGTFDKPVLTGDMDVSKGKFYVTINKMNYNFNAKLVTENQNLILRDSKMYVQDDPGRYLSTTGFIDFTNLTMNKIDLDISGDVKAFDKNNGQTELGISGDLWVGSGSPKLKILGNADRIDLTGNLLLIKGNLVFDPFAQEAYNVYTDDFTYGLIFDSLKTKDNPKGKIIKQNLDSEIVFVDLNLNPFEKIRYTIDNPDYKRKAIKQGGKFFYNLYVTTQGNVFLKFIVNKRSQQEFFGEIKTDLYIDNRDNYRMSARGVVNLGDNCYYTFFKKFDATGRAIFSGPVTNPELDIKGTYKGYSNTGSGLNGQQSIVDVIINLDVTGYATNPTLDISLNKGSSRETGSNATSDAISYLLFGKFKDQLSFDQSTSLGANIGASYLSNILSSQIENILPWIINTNINYVDSEGGTLAGNADIRFTAAIGDAIVRFGGQIFKGIANTDIIVDYPLNKLLKVESLSNNLFIRVERVYDPFSESNDVSNSSGTRAGALIYYKIKY